MATAKKVKKAKKPMTREQISKLGGLATKKKYGSAHFSQLVSKRHAANRKRKADELKAAQKLEKK